MGVDGDGAVGGDEIMTAGSKEIITRQRYLDRALLFANTDLVKVVTGVRRCGKSTLLEMVRRQLQDSVGPGFTSVAVNLESRARPVATEVELYEYIRAHLNESGRTYVFIDEPQRLKGWQDAVNAMRVDFDCDIYLTGSNAYLLSSELSTYLSGRYVEIEMLPLAFSEYLDFCGVSFARGSSVGIAADGNPVLFDDLFARYLRYGGMPAIASLDIAQEAHSMYLSGMYEAVAARDIVNRGRVRGESGVANPDLLRRITEYLADNIGNPVSANAMAGALSDAGASTTNKTVSVYISALDEAYLFYRAPRYDLHGKEILKTNPKQYIVDLGLRTHLAGYRVTDLGRMFENAVYLQLRYLGYSVRVGKLYQREVDFVAVKDGETTYMQVADAMYDESTRERELAPLRSIRDAHPKMVVVRLGSYDSDIDGIRIVGAREFFLDGTTIS